MHNPSEWQTVVVRHIADETPTVKTYTFELPNEVSHLAGQHYEIRLTSADGYQAARLYSVASPAAGTNTLELTIALVEDGEVTPYIYDDVKEGDQLEIRGPLGKFFVWHPESTDPLLLIGGGSGVVPLRCMLQAHKNAGSRAAVQLLYSARNYDEIIYKSELLTTDAPITVTLTDDHPDDWQGPTGFINEALIKQALAKLPEGSKPICYICGSTPFVEAMANLLVSMGIAPARIKAERFGPAAK